MMMNFFAKLAKGKMPMPPQRGFAAPVQEVAVTGRGR